MRSLRDEVGLWSSDAPETKSKCGQRMIYLGRQRAPAGDSFCSVGGRPRLRAYADIYEWRAPSEKLFMCAEEAETPPPRVCRVGGGTADGEGGSLHWGSLGGQRKGWEMAASNSRVEEVGGAA